MSKKCAICKKDTKGGRIYSGLSNEYYCGDCYEKTEIKEKLDED